MSFGVDLLGVEPEYILYLDVSQRLNPILNGATMPYVIKNCLVGLGGVAARGVLVAAPLKLKTNVKLPCKSIVISSQSRSFIRHMI